MNFLLLGGAPSVGKSECIYRLTNHLITSKGFNDVLNRFPSNFQDFMLVLSGVNKSNKRIRIIVNTPTDLPKNIDDFKNFSDKYCPCDILISTIRDHDFWPRSYFLSTFGINKNNNNVIEIPLAKVTRRGANRNIALNWYQNNLDDLVKLVLNNTPFNI